jgi:hypothetical protein
MIDIEKLHTTPMSLDRIRRNLDLNVEDVVDWCKEAVHKSDTSAIKRQGKNWYVIGDGFVLTINAHSHTIITAHKSKS